jgi:hypothetical protein
MSAQDAIIGNSNGPINENNMMIIPPAAASALAPEASMAVNPFLLQQEMLRRQELELTLASAASAGLAFSSHDAELDMLNRHENELLRIRRNAQSQIMGAELSRDRMTATNLPTDDSFRTESIEGIVALQEKRRREMEQMMGLPGRQLGEQTFNLLHPQNRTLALAGMPSSAAHQYDAFSAIGRNFGPTDFASARYHNMQRQLVEQEAFANQQNNHQLAALQNQALFGAAGMHPTWNHSNQHYQMLQRQQQLELMRMHQLPHNQYQYAAPQVQMPNGELLLPFLARTFSWCLTNISFEINRDRPVSRCGKCVVQPCNKCRWPCCWYQPKRAGNTRTRQTTLF